MRHSEKADGIVNGHEWNWREGDVHILLGCWVLEAEECRIEVLPRPSYCDRGRWECHVICPGFPINPNPIDAADMFPRYFFSLDRAKAEMEDWMEEREYTPK